MISKLGNILIRGVLNVSTKITKANIETIKITRYEKKLLELEFFIISFVLSKLLSLKDISPESS